MRRFLSRKGRFSLRQSKSGTRSASKDFYLTLPATNQNWPEEFGFRLGGTGPSYILSVVEGSSAYLAGLQPGDQVVDIEGQEVSNLSTQALIALAQTLKTVPPSIGVVSRIEQIDIAPGPDGRFGFTIVGDSPLMVEDCVPSCPAGRSGLKAGDFVMEVNGIPVKQHETAAAMIKAAQGRPLRLGVLSMSRRPKRLSNSMRVMSQSGDSVRQDRAQKALEFNKKVEEVLGEEPDVKEKLFEVLKQYAAERDVDSLADALPDILTSEDHQQLIDSVRIFIPKKHRERFDDVVSQSLMSRLKGRSFSDPSRNRLRRSRSEDHPERLLVSTRASSVPRTHAEEGVAPPARGLRKTTSLIAGHGGAAATNRRTVRVCKGNLSFGFTLRGHAPVWIDSVIPGSPAERAGLKPGDRILFLNGLDMRNCSHEKVVSMLQGSGAMPTLVVEDGPPTFTLAEADLAGGGGLGGSMSECARSPVLSSLQWVAEILPPSIRVHGRTFGQQLEHLLTLQERYTICKALENFFQHRNVDTLIVDVFPVLDTPAKQVIWQFVYQLLTYEEQEHCQNKISRFLGFKAAAAPPLEPEPAPEPHRRSSSMRVTGTTYTRNSVRGRSSDDLVIGTHLGMGVRAEPMEIGMRLAPGERQSGDGTSLPETPNNLTNLSAVYAELENMYSGKRSKSLKSRPPPTPESVLELGSLSQATSPSMHINTGGRKVPPPPTSWPEPLPSPPAPPQFYTQGLTSQTSAESNPYISLDSPPPSPPDPPDYPPSPPHHRSSKRRYTFSHPPRSEDTDRFLNALSEQLGQRVAIVDDFLSPENDFLSPENDYEEDVVQMSFPDEEDEDDEVGMDDEEDGGFLPPELSSPSDAHSSSGEDASSLTYSSSSEHIPPPPLTPPPPPPVQFNDPPPLPSMQQQQSPLQQPASLPYTPDHSPRAHLPSQRRHQGPPPPPPPRSNPPTKRQSLHKVLPTREDLLAHAALQEQKAYQEQRVYQDLQAYEDQAYQEQQQQQAYQELQQQAYQDQQQQQQAYQEQQQQQTYQEQQQQAYQEQQQQTYQKQQQVYQERQAYKEKKAYQEKQLIYQEQQAINEQKAYQEQQQAYQEQQALKEHLAYQELQAYQEQQIYQGHQSLPSQSSHQSAHSPQLLQQFHQSLPPLPSPDSAHPHASHPLYQMHQAQQLKLQLQQQQQNSQKSLQHHHHNPPSATSPHHPGQSQYSEGIYQSRQGLQAPAHHSSTELLHQVHQGHQGLQPQAHHSSTELLHQVHQGHQGLQPQAHHSSTELLHQLHQGHQGIQPQAHHSSTELLHQVHQGHQGLQPQAHHSSTELLHQVHQGHQGLQPQAHHSSTELLHQLHQGHQGLQPQAHHSSTELLHQVHQGHQGLQPQAHHSSTELLHQVNHGHQGLQPQAHHSSTELLAQAHQIQLDQPASLPAHISQEAHCQPHQSRKSLRGHQGHPIPTSPQGRPQDQQIHQAHTPHQTQPSTQRPRSIQQSHPTPHIHHIHHITPQPPPSEYHHQIHLIHSPQPAHRPQPLLSTFQPLQPQKPYPSTHHVHPSNQPRPQSQPSQHVLQAQAQSHGLSQPLTHSLSDLSESLDQPPPPPPLPPPSSPPPLPRPTPQRMDSNHMSVKRLRWEQVEKSEGTIWGQLGEDSDYEKLHNMVKYLDLELHFGTQKSPISLPELSPQPESFKKKDVVEILSHKKAYNASILIAHLKLSPSELRQILMTMSTDRLEPAHIKQLLLYAPDAEEVKQYEQYRQEPSKLSEPDQFVLQMLSVPEYKTRLQSLHFKCTLQEKTEEMRGGYDCIFKASVELKTSKKLAKILEFVLAMGNYLNNGQPKTGKTTGFKINFLTELGTTKTVDGKSTFLHILVKSLCHHFPDVLDFAKDLTMVPLATKVNHKTITSDLNDLHTTIQEIRSACQKMPATPDDRFSAIMSTFLENSHPAVQSLESLQQRAMEEFAKTASFFGEDGKTAHTEAFFGIFSDFISKFEKALSEHQTAEGLKSPRSPRMASPLAW